MNKVKEEIYEKATRNLLKKLDSMNMEKMSRVRAKNLTLLFRDSFKIPNVKYDTFMPELTRSEVEALGYDSSGFCRVASIGFKFLSDASDWGLYYISDIWPYGPHHFLKHRKTRQVFDLTFDQFDYVGINIPYNLGRPITAHADKSVLRFIESVNPQLLDLLQQRNKL